MAHEDAPSRPPGWLTKEELLAALRVEPDGKCWWCRERPAATGEHKYKASDLRRLLGAYGMLEHHSDRGIRTIRGTSGVTRDRHKVVKFAKAMCYTCNNVRSKPLDRAYETFSNYVNENPDLHRRPGVNLPAVFGGDWEESARDLGRYYVKHFASQVAEARFPIPASLRSFLDGGVDPPDVAMVLISTDSVRRNKRIVLNLGPDRWTYGGDPLRVTGHALTSYVGPVGVLYRWVEGGYPDPEQSQFYRFPTPVINCFKDEEAVLDGVPRRPGWTARYQQWRNRPRS